MLQTYVGVFKDHNELNDKIAEIESCKYNRVVDVRPIFVDREYGGKYMILFDYDAKSYTIDKGCMHSRRTCDIDNMGYDDYKCGSEYID